MKKLTSTIVMTWAFLLCGLIGVAFAYFTISALSSTNTFTTGSMNLVLNDDNESMSNTVSQSWSAQDLVPGSILPEKKIEVYNKGTIDAHHLNIIFSYTGSQNLAKNFLFSTRNNGFRYGATSDNTSVVLTNALRGVAGGTGYIVKQPNGQPFTSTTVDGVDGTSPDGKISLSELATYGKIRIEPGTQWGGIKAGTAHDLWLNADIAQGLTAQNESLDMKITFILDQDASQM